MDNNFNSIIADLNKEIKLYQQHRDKLYALILLIFYIDPPVIDPPPYRTGKDSDVDSVGSGLSVEMQLKESIGKLKKINKEFAQCLQMLSNWLPS